MNRIRHVFDSLRFLAVVFLCASAFCCGDGAAGPQTPATGKFLLIPSFENELAHIVELSEARLMLRNKADKTLALDTVFQIEPNADSLRFGFDLHAETPRARYGLTVLLVASSGDTAFCGGPVTVAPPALEMSEPKAVNVNLRYVGLGSDARSIRVSSNEVGVVTGDTLLLEAEALDYGGDPIPGTPTGWFSSDTTIALIPDAALGEVVGAGTRGRAELIASLLTGVSDTILVYVQPPPHELMAAGGNGQSGQVASTLVAPLSVAVTARDDLAVAGVTVVFGTGNGGSFSDDSVRTDSTGVASTYWTLGPTSRTQTAHVSVPFTPAIQFTFEATAIAAEAAAMQIVSGNRQSSVVGTRLPAPLTVLVLDEYGNAVADRFVSFAVTGGDGTLDASTAMTDSEGEASALWTLGPSTADSQLVEARVFDSRTGDILASVVLEATALPGAPAALGFAQQPVDATGGIGGRAAVRVEDSFGNRVTSDSSSSVTLALLPGSENPHAALVGTVSSTAVGGVAQFDEFGVDSVGTGYRLVAYAVGLAADTSAAFDVNLGPVDTVLLSPAAARHDTLGATTSYTATAHDAGGNEIPDVTFTWTLSDSGVANVDASGLVTATGYGETLVLATTRDVTGTAWFITSP